MKSNKQRRAEIKRKRLLRAEKAKRLLVTRPGQLPVGVIAADHLQLQHANCYAPLPDFYLDLPFTCRDCGSDEVWTARQQKWWYEVMKGRLDSTAVRCRACRKAERERRAEAHRLQQEGLCQKRNACAEDEE